MDIKADTLVHKQLRCILKEHKATVGVKYAAHHTPILWSEYATLGESLLLSHGLLLSSIYVVCILDAYYVFQYDGNLVFDPASIAVPRITSSITKLLHIHTDLRARKALSVDCAFLQYTYIREINEENEMIEVNLLCTKLLIRDRVEEPLTVRRLKQVRKNIRY